MYIHIYMYIQSISEVVFESYYLHLLTPLVDFVSQVPKIQGNTCKSGCTNSNILLLGVERRLDSRRMF